MNNTIHAIANSFFEVDFSLDETVSFRLSGRIGSAGSGDFVLGGAQVRLTGPGGATIFDETVVPDPGGQPIILPIDELIVVISFSVAVAHGISTVLSADTTALTHHMANSRLVLLIRIVCSTYIGALISSGTYNFRGSYNNE